jgi:hypothetical protein
MAVVLGGSDVVAIHGAAGDVVVGVDEEGGFVDLLDFGVRDGAGLGKGWEKGKEATDGHG